MGGGSTLARLVRAVAAGTDERFAAQLGGDGQSTEHTAPADLRALFAELEIARMSFAQGYEAHAEHPSLVWYCDELGVVGDKDDIAARIEKTLLDRGFAKTAPSERYPAAFVRTTADVAYRVEFEDFGTWTGGKRAAVGTRLLMRAESTQAGPAPTLTELLEAVPSLRDARIDRALYDALADEKVVHADLGGPWTRSYTFTLVLDGAAGAGERATAALLGAGFARLEGHDDEPFANFMRAASGSMAQLYPPHETGGVMLHLQPET